MLLEALLLPNNLDFGWFWIVGRDYELWTSTRETIQGSSGRSWERVWSPATTCWRAWQRLFRALSAEQEKSAMHQRGMSFRIIQRWCEQWAPTADGALLFNRLRWKKQFQDGFGAVKSTYTIFARTVFQRSFVAFDSILLIRTIAWEMTKMNADKICGLATFSPFLTPSICRCLMKLCS